MAGKSDSPVDTVMVITFRERVTMKKLKNIFKYDPIKVG